MNQSLSQDNFFLTDDTLVKMLKADHEWALKDIFCRYNLQLFRLAAGVLRDEEHAKDIVQDIFVDLWNRRHDSNIEVLPNYLTRAVKFQVLNALRNGKLKDHHLKVMENVEFINQTEQLLDLQELEETLKSAVQQLSPRCREVFELSRFDNLSHKEISSRLNISTKTVEVQIGKALAHLRTYLGKTIAIFAFLETLS